MAKIKAVASKIYKPIIFKGRLLFKNHVALECKHEHRTKRSAEMCAKRMLGRDEEWLEKIYKERGWK